MHFKPFKPFKPSKPRIFSPATKAKHQSPGTGPMSFPRKNWAQAHLARDMVMACHGFKLRDQWANAPAKLAISSPVFHPILGLIISSHTYIFKSSNVTYRKLMKIGQVASMRGWLHLRIKYCFAQSLIEIWLDILQIKYEVKRGIYACLIVCRFTKFQGYHESEHKSKQSK